MIPQRTNNPHPAAGRNGGMAKSSTSSIAKIPQTAEKSNCQKAIDLTTSEAAGIDYGIVHLRLHIEGGKLTRYTVNTERSFLAGGSNE
ncbi:hypothetical protein FACS189445_4740 [Spirochaetia bacterium]|nr:hypothetical protein FACS189445_4740 [Spirochaetia bacterium]